MMTLKTIAASLVVLATTTTAALAAPCEQPAPVPTAPVYQQPAPAPVGYLPPQPGLLQPALYQKPQATVTVRPYGHGPVVRPVTLATDIAFKGTSGQRVISAGNRAFDKLTITSNNGTTTVKQIMVTFVDGQKKMLPVNQTLQGNASLTVDVGCGPRERIASIDVFGKETASRYWRSLPPAGFTLTAV